MKEIRVVSVAEEELFAAAKYYEEQQQNLGLDFITETERAMDTIAADPTLWAIRFENFRRFLLQRFPFEIWYEDHPEFIRILAIAHQRRRTFYWNRRVDGEFPGI